MGTSLAEATTLAIGLTVVRITLVLLIGWLLHFAFRRCNPRWQISIWRTIALAVLLVAGVCMSVRGWGPQFLVPLDWNSNPTVAYSFQPPNGLATERTNVESPRQLTLDASTIAGGSSSSTPSTVQVDSKYQRHTASSASVIEAAIQVLFQGYLLVVGGLLARLLLQSIALWTVVRRAVPADDATEALVSAVAIEYGLTCLPRIVVSDRIDVPFATGVLKPMIVLPVAIANEFTKSDLRMVIAHECAHFAGHDLFWALVIQVLKILAWPHPLCWGISVAHRFVCDVRCDAVVCSRNPSGYTSMLARCALATDRLPENGLAMAFVRPSETLQRVRMIESGIEARKLSRPGRILGLLAIALVLSTAGTFGVNSFVAGTLFSQFDPEEVNYVEIKVVGPDGNPVAGAEILVDALRTKKEGASAYGNRPANRATTNEEGIAHVPYPKYVHEEMETGALGFRITHPEFVAFESQGTSVDSPIEVTLRSGRSIQLTVIDSTSGNLVNEGVFVLRPAHQTARPWNRVDEGTFVSPPIGEDVSALLVVGIREGMPALFSDLIHLDRLPPGDCRLKGVRLNPGRSIKGRLSDEATRPIRNGQIGLTLAVSVSDEPSYGDCILWNDVADIAQDGTFEFLSVPRGVPVQLHANCDGWVSVSAPPDEILERFPYVKTEAHADRMHNTIVIAQQFPQEEDAIVLEMEPTADCHFRITDASDNPVSGATISMSPNKATAPGPGGIVGHYFRTETTLGMSIEEMLRPHKEPETMKLQHSAMPPNTAITDADGRATIRNLPKKQGIGIGVHHNEYELPLNPRNPFHRVTEADLSGGTLQVDIELQRIGTEVLGR